mmetsp:Transcript_92606/g.285880  ORF Transcript_92606/g.285880 Transcript_92606/m.285880 type:complete len:273 (+) Transcript_92606:146-964(+)
MSTSPLMRPDGPAVRRSTPSPTTLCSLHRPVGHALMAEHRLKRPPLAAWLPRTRRRRTRTSRAAAPRRGLRRRDLPRPGPMRQRAGPRRSPGQRPAWTCRDACRPRQTPSTTAVCLCEEVLLQRCCSHLPAAGCTPSRHRGHSLPSPSQPPGRPRGHQPWGRGPREPPGPWGPRRTAWPRSARCAAAAPARRHRRRRSPRARALALRGPRAAARSCRKAGARTGAHLPWGAPGKARTGPIDQASPQLAEGAASEAAGTHCAPRVPGHWQRPC